jgi:hypothetical protein
VIGRDPKLDGGILQRGVIYRFRVPRRPDPNLNPEAEAIARRIEEAQVREFLESRRRAS